MIKIKALIVEDELNNQELLTNLLKQYCEHVEVCGVAESVSDAVSKIESHSPDIVFLDYQLQGGSGFDVLDAIDNPTFKVIFITGYSEYAIKAFKYAALDYILKPINISELVDAVKRFEPGGKNYSTNYSYLKAQIVQTEKELDKMVIPDKKGYQVVDLNEVIFVQAINSFVKFYLVGGEVIVSTQSLKYYEELLSKDLYFKIHKSYIINIYMVKSVSPGRGGKVLLSGGHGVPIAIRRKPIFLKFLKSRPGL